MGEVTIVYKQMDDEVRLYKHPHITWTLVSSQVSLVNLPPSIINKACEGGEQSKSAV